jgi:hypothetical protein
MNTITCSNCGEEIEVNSALHGQIEAQIIADVHKRHEHELAQVRAESETAAKKQAEAVAEHSNRQLAGEKELLKHQADAELELTKRRIQAEADAGMRKLAGDQEMLIQSLRLDAASEKESGTKLRAQLGQMMTELRDERKAHANAELEAQRKIAEEEGRIRETATREADERQRLNMAAKDKTIQDMQKAMDDMQRKAALGSQQLQGEIMELDFEASLADAFRDDVIEPVAKGVRGGDIRQVVRSPRGTVCGVILWEIKRTKNWTDAWIGKLKEDLRDGKANLPIIVTEAMPKHAAEDIAMVEGVWVCKPQLAITLGTLLRKSLVDVGRERAIGENRSTSAEALYDFVTSHEFVQQIEVMVETYQEMTLQVTKERVAYEKLWAQREKQAQRLMMGTANIIGSMQGQIGTASMPRIKGLELLDAGDEPTPVR